ncbi:MAG: helicase-related protein, partial [Thermacetogeniaceae bacterium]
LLNLYGRYFDEYPACFLNGAARVAGGFRTLFNLPDTITLIRKESGEELRYWESVLDYCINGNLQAVMDEYLHVLREALGLFETPVDEAVEKLSHEVAAAVSIKTVNLSFDVLYEEKINSYNLRCRFALRFGDAKNADEEGETRSDQVRSAFNSPFRPFILATTSIGQEGLDFHQYCHEVYHWNLPSNPVDLEQREGRIHRYKGHVIRRNIAKTYTLLSLKETLKGLQDPWQLLFEAAYSECSKEKSDLVPFWIYERGGYKIVRHIPALPLSREISRLNELKRALVAYRMVLGQPRQEDLLRCIESYLEGKICADELAEFRIDLSPPDD